MARIRAPTHAVFLGGAGTSIGETVTDQEWLIEALLSDEYDDAPEGEPTDFRAYFVNTDTSETPKSIEEDVEKTVENVRAGIDDPIDVEIDSKVLDLGDFDPGMLHPDYVTNENNIAPIMRDLGLDAWWLEEGQTVDSLDGLQSQGVNRKRGLTKAIHRLGQHDTDPFGDLVNDLQNFNDDPEVAVIVGLGGGTGSGLLIDLAYRLSKEVEEGVDLTLFAGLPTPTGDDKTNELANAYAALSELEYLALNDRNLFETIHLLPYEAVVDETAFEKAVTYALLSWYNLDDDWDARLAFVGGNDNGPPAYAPFTLTVPQFLRYVTEDVDETERNVERYIDKKQDAIKAEEDLIEDLENAVRAIVDDDTADLLVDDPNKQPEPRAYRLEDNQALRLRNEIESLRDLLSQSYMRRIGYRAPEKLQKDIDDTLEISKEEAEWDRDAEQRAAVARDFVDRLPGAVGSPNNYQPNDGWEGDEKELIETCINQFALIKRRAGLYRAISALNVDEPPVVEASIDVASLPEAVATDVKKAIDPNDAGRTSAFNTFIHDLKSAKEQKAAQKAALEKVIEEGAPDKVKEKASVNEDLEADLREYYSLYDSREELITLLDALESEVENVVNTLIPITSPDQVPDSILEFDKFDELQEAYHDHDDVEAPDRKTVEGAVRNLVNAREYQLKAQEAKGTLTEMVRSILGRSKVAKYRDNYYDACGRIDSEVIETPEWNKPFDTNVEVNQEYFDAGVDDELERARKEIDEIVEENLQEARKLVTGNPSRLLPDDDDIDPDHLPSIDTDDVGTDADQIEDWFEEPKWGENLPGTFDAFKNKFKNDALQIAFESIFVNPFTEKKSEVNEDIGELTEAITRYEDLRDARTEKGGNFQRAYNEVPDTDSLSVYDSPKKPGPFKNEIEPANEGFIGSNQDLGEAGVYDDKDEWENVVTELRNVLPNYETDHFPLKEMSITHSSANNSPYDGHVVRSVFLSTAFEGYTDDQTAHIEGIWEDLKYNYIDKNDYGAAKVPVADDHEVAMTTFLGGIFLDNLAIAVDQCRQEYRDSMKTYLQEELENIDDRHIALGYVPELVERHTYGLDGTVYHGDGEEESTAPQAVSGKETQQAVRFLPPDSDGGFPYRSDTINVKRKQGKMRLLDPNEDELVEMLRRKYYRIVGYPSTVNPDTDQR